MREGEHAPPYFEELETSPEAFSFLFSFFYFSIDWVLTPVAKT